MKCSLRTWWKGEELKTVELQFWSVEGTLARTVLQAAVQPRSRVVSGAALPLGWAAELHST
jgi:hypothetical protein